MPDCTAHTLGKQERLSGKLLTDRLFTGGNSRSVVAFPIRLVYMRMERATEDTPPASIMVSIPKRCLKRAVMRNRAKRQIREAYRLNKHMLKIPAGKRIALAFIWLDSKLYDSHVIEHKVQSLLHRINERI